MELSQEQKFKFRLRLEQEQAQQEQSNRSDQPDMSGSFPEATNLLHSDQSIGRKAWDALQVPSQMAQRGLEQLSEVSKPNPEITGNLARDVVANYPSVSASVLSQVAPNMINRASLLTAGAANIVKGAIPLAQAAGRGLANQMDQMTGAVPGSMRAAFNDSSLIRAPGKAATGPLYQAARAEMQPGESIFTGLYQPTDIVDTAKEYMAKGGKLEPAEALMYRKALSNLISKKSVIPDELIPMRQEADAIAKTDPNIAKADPMYVRGRMAESLRNLMPQNKYGGASAFKMGIIAALQNMGVPGKMVGAVMSPAVSGVASTVAGIGARALAPIVSSPSMAIGSKEAMTELIRRRAEKRGMTTHDSMVEDSVDRAKNDPNYNGIRIR